MGKARCSRRLGGPLEALRVGGLGLGVIRLDMGDLRTFLDCLEVWMFNVSSLCAYYMRQLRSGIKGRLRLVICGTLCTLATTFFGHSWGNSPRSNKRTLDPDPDRRR